MPNFRYVDAIRSITGISPRGPEVDEALEVAGGVSSVHEGNSVSTIRAPDKPREAYGVDGSNAVDRLAQTDREPARVGGYDNQALEELRRYIADGFDRLGRAVSDISQESGKPDATDSAEGQDKTSCAAAKPTKRKREGLLKRGLDVLKAGYKGASDSVKKVRERYRKSGDVEAETPEKPKEEGVSKKYVEERFDRLECAVSELTALTKGIDQVVRGYNDRFTELVEYSAKIRKASGIMWKCLKGGVVPNLEELREYVSKLDRAVDKAIESQGSMAAQLSALDEVADLPPIVNAMGEKIFDPKAIVAAVNTLFARYQERVSLMEAGAIKRIEDIGKESRIDYEWLGRKIKDAVRIQMIGMERPNKLMGAGTDQDAPTYIGGRQPEQIGKLVEVLQGIQGNLDGLVGVKSGIATIQKTLGEVKQVDDEIKCLVQAQANADDMTRQDLVRQQAELEAQRQGLLRSAGGNFGQVVETMGRVESNLSQGSLKTIFGDIAREVVGDVRTGLDRYVEGLGRQLGDRIVGEYGTRLNGLADRMEAAVAGFPDRDYLDQRFNNLATIEQIDSKLSGLARRGEIDSGVRTGVEGGVRLELSGVKNQLEAFRHELGQTKPTDLSGVETRLKSLEDKLNGLSGVEGALDRLSEKVEGLKIKGFDETRVRSAVTRMIKEELGGGKGK